MRNSFFRCEAFKQGVALAHKLRHRRAQAKRSPTSLADLVALAKESEAPVTKLKPGYHLGHSCVPCLLEPPTPRHRRTPQVIPKRFGTPHLERALELIQDAAAHGAPITRPKVRALMGLDREDTERLFAYLKRHRMLVHGAKVGHAHLLLPAEARA